MIPPLKLYVPFTNNVIRPAGTPRLRSEAALPEKSEPSKARTYLPGDV